jgi:hypothetical protein
MSTNRGPSNTRPRKVANGVAMAIHLWTMRLPRYPGLLFSFASAWVIRPYLSFDAYPFRSRLATIPVLVASRQIVGTPLNRMTR